MNAKSMLDREFLEMRSRLLDLAASMDRIDRDTEPGTFKNDPRLGFLRNAMHLLADGKPDRVVRMQMHFSDAYDSGWRDEMGFSSRAASQ